MSTAALTPRADSNSNAQKTTSSLVIAPADHDLTVVIPAHNEEQRLPKTLAQLAAFLDGWGVDYRVLVADDGSSDRTDVLARHHGPRCSTLRMSPQGGKGRAVRTAMLRATGRVLAFTDADLPFDLTAMQQGYEMVRRGECQVVFGARDMKQSESIAQRRMARQMATFAFREVVKRLISREVTDTQCGMKVFSRQAALDIFARTTIDGFAFDAEVVLLTHRLGLPFERVPVKLIHEFASTLSLHRNALPMLCDVFRLWLRDRLGRERPTPRFLYLEADPTSEADRQRRAA
jgi:dolichyl-phosphate beta-glucosyltransferase